MYLRIYPIYTQRLTHTLRVQGLIPWNCLRVDRGEASTWISHRQTPSFGLFVGFTTIQSPSINWNMILPSHPFLCISHNRSRNGKFLLQLITLSRKVSVLLPPRLIISRQTLPTCLQGRVQ